MARIIPDPLVGSVTPEAHKVYRAIRAIPGDGITAWMCLPLPGNEARPEFLVVHRDTTAFVLAVSSLSVSEAEEVVHGGLFSEGRVAPETLALPQRTMAREFVDTIVGERAVGSGDRAVFSIVLFPNVPHATLRQAFPENPHDEVYWLGADYVSPDGLLRSFERLATGALSGTVLAVLRSRFTPESVMPPRFSARGLQGRRVGAELTVQLLDYDQEWWTKHRLSLPSDGQTMVEEAAVSGEASLVTGVAGSGKSLVLLYRACHQARLRPEGRSLVLTHNRALRGELELRFGELGSPPNVEWGTFFSWADRHMRQAESRFEILQYAQRDDAISAAAEPFFGRIEARQVEFLRDEFDWMQDRDVVTLEKYLAVDRIGRGVRLSDDQRRKVFRVFERYSEELGSQRREDWAGRALRFLRLVEAGEVKLPSYDFIYVDEAQFFAPVWFRVVRQALHPRTGKLFLAADPTQGFLKRRQSWLACGLELRGRSTRLRRSYRNTRQILEFAAAFYRNRIGDEDDDLNLPDAAELSSALQGASPLLLQQSSRQDEVTRVGNEICSYLQSGGHPADVLVLVGSGARTSSVFSSLAQMIGAEKVCDARKSTGTRHVRVCALDGATGLEAPIVFVIGAAEILEHEADLQLSADQRDELMRDNTRRLYMAFTRAAYALFITWVGTVPDALTRSLAALHELHTATERQ